MPGCWAHGYRYLVVHGLGDPWMHVTPNQPRTTVSGRRHHHRLRSSAKLGISLSALPQECHVAPFERRGFDLFA